jgi:hypothetical protein
MTNTPFEKAALHELRAIAVALVGIERQLVQLVEIGRQDPLRGLEALIAATEEEPGELTTHISPENEGELEEEPDISSLLQRRSMLENELIETVGGTTSPAPPADPDEYEMPASERWRLG